MPDTTSNQLASSFLDFSRKRLVEQNWPNLRAAVESLTDEQVWWRPNEASNSIGNLLLHLNGNLGQLVLVPFNGAEDNRDRPREFHATEQPSGAELLQRLGATIKVVDQILARLSPENLLATYTIRGGQTSGIALIYRFVEHFALHYGQIVFIAKALTAKDLGFSTAANQASPAK